MIDSRQQVTKEILSKRNFLKNVYRTEEGTYELARIVRECGVFDQVAADPGMIALHNFGIRLMEDLGLLDGESLIPLLKWMLEDHEWKKPVD